MAVKRNPKPLSILVHSSLEDLPEIRALSTKGHTVVSMRPDEAQFDIIFSPFAWRMTPELVALVDVSIKARRSIKFKRKSKDEDDE